MKRSQKSFVGNKCKGLTLIEVIASIVLVSTLLVLILESWSRHRRQIQRADWHRRAAAQLDVLMAEWFSKQQAFPVEQIGAFQGEPSLFWRSRLNHRPITNSEWRTDVLNVSVFHRIEPTSPLCSLDLLVPIPAVQ